MGSLSQLSAPIGLFWTRRSRAERLSLVTLLVASVVCVFVFLKLGSNQTYAVAFTNLEARDSAAAVDQLKADKIPYQVTPDGGTIRVAANRLADARLKLASKGLPQGGAVGFELFDKTSFGVTDFVQNVNYQRALEGELTRTIDTLEQVEASRVHIVVPKQELFVSEQKPATASVVLRLRVGKSLDASQLRGIAHMIARSVEGLDEKNITVLNTAGKLLFDGSTTNDVAGGLSATQMDAQAKVEKGLEGDLQSLLDRVTGPNRSVVRVKADLDFSSADTVSESFAPGGTNGQGVPRSSSSVQETYNGAGLPGGQIPGASANLPTTAATSAATPGAASQYQRSETTTNFEVTKTTERNTRSPGTIKRLSVSVFLDSSISEQDAAGLHDAVAAAAGIDAKRGDQLVITTAAFSGAQAAESIPVVKPGLLDTLTPTAKIAAPVLIALFVLLAVWRMSRTTPAPRFRTTVVDGTLALPPGRRDASSALANGAGAGMGLTDGDERSGGRGLSAPGGAQIAAPSDPVADQARHRTEARARLADVATANPEAMAMIIQTWMNQDRAGGRS